MPDSDLIGLRFNFKSEIRRLETLDNDDLVTEAQILQDWLFYALEEIRSLCEDRQVLTPEGVWVQSSIAQIIKLFPKKN